MTDLDGRHPILSALMKFLEAQRSSHHNLVRVIDAQYEKDSVTVDRLNRKCAEDVKSTMYVLVELRADYQILITVRSFQ